MTALMIASSVLAGRWTVLAGPRWSITIGCLLLACGLFLTDGYLSPHPDYGPLILALALAGIGIGTTVVPITSSVLAAVPPERSGMAASASNTSREIGAVTGVAILGSLVYSQLARDLVAQMNHLGVPPGFRAAGRAQQARGADARDERANEQPHARMGIGPRPARALRRVERGHRDVDARLRPVYRSAEAVRIVNLSAYGHGPFTDPAELHEQQPRACDLHRRRPVDLREDDCQAAGLARPRGGGQRHAVSQERLDFADAEVVLFIMRRLEAERDQPMPQFRSPTQRCVGRRDVHAGQSLVERRERFAGRGGDFVHARPVVGAAAATDFDRDRAFGVRFVVHRWGLRLESNSQTRTPPHLSVSEHVNTITRRRRRLVVPPSRAHSPIDGSATEATPQRPSRAIANLL